MRCDGALCSRGDRGSVSGCPWGDAYHSCLSGQSIDPITYKDEACLSLSFLFKKKFRSSLHGAVEANPTRNHEAAGLIPGLTQWVGDLALP